VDDLPRRLALAEAEVLRERALLDRALRGTTPAARHSKAAGALLFASAVSLFAGAALGACATSDAVAGPTFTGLILHQERMYSQHYETQYCAKELVTLRAGDASCEAR